MVDLGITLLELDQSELAEKFVAQALSLLRYVSANLASNWNERMQVGKYVFHSFF